ncbi:hypothetical protein GCM10022222_49700 [Amycolatopsis ultiminotia]|uniref:Secreted protein n=1 Tax=Amycolatopsis ultiminotia TaxID=543629 RepID=A0ABP6X427_9PSEU
MRIARKVVAPVVLAGVVAGGLLATTAEASAATQIHGVWSTKKACENAQWKSLQKHPGWWFSGCYWDNPNGMVGYWYTSKS